MAVPKCISKFHYVNLRVSCSIWKKNIHSSCLYFNYSKASISWSSAGKFVSPKRRLLIVEKFGALYWNFFCRLLNRLAYLGPLQWARRLNITSYYLNSVLVFSNGNQIFSNVRCMHYLIGKHISVISTHFSSLEILRKCWATKCFFLGAYWIMEEEVNVSARRTNQTIN